MRSAGIKAGDEGISRPMREKKALFTVGVVSYKNYRFLCNALASIFLQDYSEIELIISNDGSSDFNEEKLISYLNEHRTENIKRVIINNSERNLGTSKQLNQIISVTTGRYLFFLAADDTLDNPSVLSRLADTFCRNSDPFAVCGNCSLYDNSLQKWIPAAPNKAEKEKLRSFTSIDLYRSLSSGMFIPTAATAYSMKAFDILGSFDERVFLLEDWSFFLKMTRSGYKPVYMDIPVVKHRSDGIAYGYESQLLDSKKRFDSDEMAIIELELLPYRKLLGRVVYTRLKQRHRLLRRLWFEQYEWSRASQKEKLAFSLQGLPESLPKALLGARHKLVASCIQRRFTGLAIWTATFALLYANDYSSLLGGRLGTELHEFFGVMSLIVLTASLFGILVKYLYKIYVPLKIRRKKIK